MSRFASWLSVRTGKSREGGLSFVLALQAGIMFVLAPLAASGLLPPAVLDTFRMALAATAVILLARNRYVSTAIIATFLATVLFSSLGSSSQATIAGLERIGALTGYDVAIAWAVANVAFGEGRVSAHRIMGAIILYLSIALVFANAYRTCALLLHPSFKGLDNAGHFFNESLYFSLSTLTTSGFGDITPLHPLVRSLANLEAVIGQLFPATLLARLVTLHAAGETESTASR